MYSYNDISTCLESMCFLQIENMDALFEAQFSPLADSGRLLSKCGKCGRYMKYISTQPMRLYCITCEDVYYLPQNGSIKVITLISYIGNLPLFCFFLNQLIYFHEWLMRIEPVDHVLEFKQPLIFSGQNSLSMGERFLIPYFS